LTYEQIWSWVYENFSIQGYFSAQDLINDVRAEFARTNSPFPEQAEDLIRYRFQFRSEYAQMQAKEEEALQVAELLGNGRVMESLSDQMVEELNNPRSEIMDIDLTEYATTRETVIPPEIVKFAKRESFFTRVTRAFGNLFRRK